jgi:hypothetical protein
MKIPKNNPGRHLIRRTVLFAIISAFLPFGCQSSGFLVVAQAQDADAEYVLAKARTAFGGKTPKEITNYLAALRPAPVSEADRQLLLESIPLINEENRVTDSGQINALRARIRPVLEFYDRLKIVEVILFKDERPLSFNKPGAVVAFSTGLLDLVKADAALMGIAAHELAHECLALEFYHAYRARDFQKLRRIELICDAIATVTLVVLGADPKEYGDVLVRICNHTPAAAELNDGRGPMPSWQTRQRVITEVAALPSLTITPRGK